MDRAPFTPHLEYDLDIEEYHSRPEEISKSGLDLIAQSPAKYFAWNLDPARPARETKSGQLEGSLAHCAILEPAEFDLRYAVGPNVSRITKEWKAFEAALAPGIQAIKSSQYTTAMRQAESVRKISDVREALDRGRSEVSAFWTDPVTSVRCRCRPDFVHEVHSSADILLDVKTFSDASANEFKRQIARKRYHVQDQFYSEGYATASGRDVLGFIFVAVETEWPYAANAVMLDPVSKDVGLALARRDLLTYSQCLKNGTWPGYGDGIDVVSLPNWALNEIEV